MIKYFIERDGAVIASGYCKKEDVPFIDVLGGKLVFETKLSKVPPNSKTSVLIKRQQLLEASDWTQLPDVPLKTRMRWAEYRQMLRDVPQQSGFPDVVYWPEVPA